ncbi:uncharacterized protein PV07_01495 [Cladophialophora immunda]|uniref:Uncharacterized protein n=1 Tax=Cladophialophora immunda TaxID=569365 RepID=A0A0D2BAZ5_9EURO|nr:uncharacterized protein PV07_01495 [Cladophialophora immunda]KIW34737.1 hypothetical protein PV07_01495 [Cladophialophora immunda]
MSDSMKSSQVDTYVIKEASQLSDGSIEAISWPKTAGGPQVRVVIDSSEALLSFLGSLSQKSGDIVYVIRQNYSWDKLSVTRDLLLHVLKTHGVFLPFLDSVSAFGFKLHDDDETWEGYHEATVWEGSGNQRTLVSREISYTYRYYTRNGRNDDSAYTPAWLKFQTLGHATLEKPGMGALHMVFLNEALEGWKGFITELRLTLNDLELQSSVKYYESVIRSMIDTSASTAALLAQIPYFVLIENLGSSSSALQASIIDLRNIAATVQTGNEDMLGLARESRKDSTKVKTLTFISIFYLPATLLATIFGSDLVQPMHFWVYVLATVIATILTLAVPIYLERKHNPRLWANILSAVVGTGPAG